MYSFHSFLISALAGGEWLTPRPSRLAPRKTNPRYSLNGTLCEVIEMRKYFLPLPGAEIRSSFSISRHYTNWAIVVVWWDEDLGRDDYGHLHGETDG